MVKCDERDKKALIVSLPAIDTPRALDTWCIILGYDVQQDKDNAGNELAWYNLQLECH